MMTRQLTATLPAENAPKGPKASTVAKRSRKLIKSCMFGAEM